MTNGKENSKPKSKSQKMKTAGNEAQSKSDQDKTGGKGKCPATNTGTSREDRFKGCAAGGGDTRRGVQGEFCRFGQRCVGSDGLSGPEKPTCIAVW